MFTKLGSLMFVDQQDVGVVQELSWDRLVGREIGQDRRSGLLGHYGRPHDGLHRDLEAQANPGCPNKHAGRHIGRGECAVGSRGHDDDVLPRLIHEDDRRASGKPRFDLNLRCINPCPGQGPQQQVAVAVVPDRSDHPDLPSQTGGGDCLVRALATRQDSEITARHGLARLREPCGLHRQVGIERSDDDD